MESTQERALKGLIELWADVYSTEIYFIQGKRFTAGQLKTYVKAALAEPDSSIHKVIEAEPKKAAACIKYGSIPMRVRRNIIMQNLIRKELRDNELLYFFDGSFYLAAVLHINFGITFAEAEKRMKQSFGRMLSRITLRQLLSEPSKNDIPSEFRLHTWLSSLPLSPASIAGANVRLRQVLHQQRKTFSSDMCYYEQDLKEALLDCWNGSHVDECVKILRDQGDTTQQMVTFKRILDGQEPKLLRTMLLAMLRRTIDDLPGIHQEVKRLERQTVEVPLDEEILANQAADNGEYEDALANLLDRISQKKVNISRLGTRGLNLLNEELNRIQLVKTRKEYYGQDEDRIKQQSKRLFDKLKAEAG